METRTHKSIVIFNLCIGFQYNAISQDQIRLKPFRRTFKQSPVVVDEVIQCNLLWSQINSINHDAQFQNDQPMDNLRNKTKLIVNL